MATTDIPTADHGGNLNSYFTQPNNSGLWGLAAQTKADRAATDHSEARRLSEVSKAFHIPMSEYTTRELLHEIVRSSDFVGQSKTGASIFIMALSDNAVRALEMFDPLNDPDLENECSEDQPASVGNYELHRSCLDSDFEPDHENGWGGICETEATGCPHGEPNAIDYDGSEIERPSIQLNETRGG